MHTVRLDHLVLTVTDLKATISFYSKVLGMETKQFGEGRVALHFGNQKINLHLRGHESEPKAAQPQPGSADLCFLTEMSLAGIIKHLQHHHVSIIAGPVPRTGACGAMTSVYVRDPDNNLVEIATRESNGPQCNRVTKP